MELETGHSKRSIFGGNLFTLLSATPIELWKSQANQGTKTRSDRQSGECLPEKEEWHLKTQRNASNNTCYVINGPIIHWYATVFVR